MTEQSLLEKPVNEILDAIRRITSRREGVVLFRAELTGKARLGVLKMLSALLGDVAETFEEQQSRALTDPRSSVPSCSRYISELEDHRKAKRLLRKAFKKNPEAAIEAVAPYVFYFDDKLRRI